MSYMPALSIVRETSETEIAKMCVALLSDCGYELGEFNPHRVSAWLISAEGALFIAIGSHEQEALDNCVNVGLFDQFLADTFDHDDILDADESEFYNLGGASESFWISHLMMNKIVQA